MAATLNPPPPAQPVPKEESELEKKHRKFIDKMKENMITPQESLLWNVVIISALALFSIGLLALLSILNFVSGGATIALFGYYFYYNMNHKEDIGLGEIGIQMILGNPKEKGSRVFSPGKHGGLFPFWYPHVVSLQQTTIIIPEFEINAAADVRKIIRMKIPSSSAQMSIWNPWRYNEVVGEGILGENGGLVKALQSAMREEATEYGDGELRKDKTKLVKAADKKADELSEQWGMEIKNITLPEIAPVNSAVSESHEKNAIEREEAISEGIEAAATRKRINEYIKLGLTPLEAAIQDGVERNKHKGREHIVISSGSGNGDGGGGLDATVARVGSIFGATVGAQLQKKLSGDEENNREKRKRNQKPKGGKR